MIAHFHSLGVEATERRGREKKAWKGGGTLLRLRGALFRDSGPRGSRPRGTLLGLNFWTLPGSLAPKGPGDPVRGGPDPKGLQKASLATPKSFKLATLTVRAGASSHQILLYIRSHFKDKWVYKGCL